MNCFCSFQIANCNSSFLVLKTTECVLINLRYFSLRKFISTVSDGCSLYSLSLSEVERSSPLSLSNKICDKFSWLCWKQNAQKMVLKIHLRLPLAFYDILNNLNFIAETRTEIFASTGFVLNFKQNVLWLCYSNLPFHLSLTSL